MFDRTVLYMAFFAFVVVNSRKVFQNKLNRATKDELSATQLYF